MKKMFLVSIFVLAFSFNLFADDFEVEDEQSAATIYLLLNPGIIIPEQVLPAVF